MRRPDFFIVGAPKCGTTALYDYLSQHPDVFVPPTKEIHFFGRDLYSPTYLRDGEKYLSLFAGARDEKRVGEASVWYLYSKQSAREIKEFSPEARIIIMLRNPVDMIYSLHSQRLYIGTEDIEDFAEALRAEPERKRGLRLPQNPYLIEGLFYREVGKYTDQVQRYLDVFGRERVKVIVYDDFKSDTARIYGEACEFLEVDSGFRPDIRIVNPNKRVRSKAVRALLDNPPPLLRTLGKPLTTRPFRHRFLKRLRRLNTNFVARPPLPAELRRELQSEFAPDVERLSRLLERDLTHWCAAQ
jgi:hypothetical protein